MSVRSMCVCQEYVCEYVCLSGVCQSVRSNCQSVRSMRVCQEYVCLSGVCVSVRSMCVGVCVPVMSMCTCPSGVCVCFEFVLVRQFVACQEYVSVRII